MHRLNRIATASLAAATIAGCCTPAYANTSPHVSPNVVRTDGANTSVLSPDGLGSCGQSWNTRWRFTAYCSGTGPMSYEGIALCKDNVTLWGIIRWDGDVRGSVVDCSNDGGLSNDWGICLYTSPNGHAYSWIAKHGTGLWGDCAT